MSDPFLAQIVMFGSNFAPRSWAFCDGQLLPISQNSALFSLLGTIYGGDGRTSFGLPEMRGRVPIHAGNGPGLSPRRLGERGGSESETLTQAQIPQHNHNVTMRADSRSGNTDNPAGNIISTGSGTTLFRPNSARDDVNMASDALTQNNVGGSQSHNNMQPFIAVNYIIALQGIFPSRN
ncbi:tail fiber protein [uncultured Litoreibacter sp.]|uniref:phage tail protein n=1 Tax=uncultured Litoreibacter sp. TaxID=1392394 RepID=UPI00261B7AE7|nr:tail fiber protein [uncultured Litoreibacter sp.]